MGIIDEDQFVSGAGDKRWMLVVEGQGDDYSGPAVDPRHLSLWENLVGIGRAPGANASQTDGLQSAVGWRHCSITRKVPARAALYAR